MIFFFFFILVELSSVSGGQFINLCFKRLSKPLHLYLCLCVCFGVYRYLCFLIVYKKSCYLVCSKLRLLKDNCKGMPFVSFSQNNVNKNLWTVQKGMIELIIFHSSNKGRDHWGLNTI